MPVLAADEIPITFDELDELDEDHDGYITEAEINEQSELSKSWSIVDKDSNLKLDINESSAYSGKGRFAPPGRYGGT